MVKTAIFVAVILAGVKIGKDLAAKLTGGTATPGL